MSREVCVQTHSAQVRRRVYEGSGKSTLLRWADAINHMNVKSVIPLMLSLLAATPGSAQQVIYNGTFDADASGWTTQDVPFDGYRSGKGNPGGFFALDQPTPSSGTDPMILQVLSGLVPGDTYLVSGDYERLIDRGGGAAGAFSFGVAFDGVHFFNATTPPDFAWHRFAFNYTAVSSSTILSPAAQINGTGASYGIDNISMRIVPEPTTVSLLLLGMAVTLCGKSSRTRLL